MDEHPDRALVRENGRYWDRLAAHRHGEPVSFFARGSSALMPEELEILGDTAGLRVLHLACSTGDEALTFAQRGAVVTAVDLAESHISTASSKATALGLDVEFVVADITALPASLAGFDVIYLSWGGICWIPDLASWTAEMTRRLLPGGRLVVSEHHPLWEVLTVRGVDEVEVRGDYFTPRRDGYPDPLKAPAVTRDLHPSEATPHSFVWGLGSVVEAVVGAGMVVERLTELPDPAMYPGLGDAAARIPAIYILSARRAR